MKAKLSLPIKISAVLFLLALLEVQTAKVFGQGTAFTYQGRLNASGGSANGNYDLVFSLYASSTGGTRVAGPVTNATTGVTNGLFVVTIDFGMNAFTGSSNWLDISVRTNGASGFTELTPRQQLTPAPYAIFAESANASGLTGVVPTNALPGFQASGYNAVGGGFGNSTLAIYSTIGGGYSNVTSDYFTTIGGGNGNKASIQNATVGGGSGNISGGLASVVSGGQSNQATGPYATAGGGIYNTARGAASFIGGGVGNFANQTYATIGGGQQNTNTSASGAIAGGQQNVAGGIYQSTIGGGYNNTNNASYAVIGGGFQNYNSGEVAAIAGGVQNIASGPGAFIGGGGYTGGNALGNTASGADSAVGSGIGNLASGDYSIIGGGQQNTNTSQSGTIAGGQQNTVNSQYQGSIGGGVGNSNSANYAVIGGGFQNNNSGTVATIAGGLQNIASGQGAFIGGGGYDGNLFAGNTASGQASVIGGGLSNLNSGYSAVIGGGYSNSATGSYSTIPGGLSNVASGPFSFAAGQQAQAGHQGAFVWADSQSAPFLSTANDEFLVRAQGGVGINMNNPNGASLYVQGNRTNGWMNSMSWFENTNTGTNDSPALRVVADGNAPFGALSVSTAGSGFIAQFGNGVTFVSQLDVNGNWTAASFSGNGSGLTSLSAPNLSGSIPSASLTSVPAASLTGAHTLPAAVLPASVVTNTETSVTLSGTFNGIHSGNGSGLTSLSASALTGTVALAQLPTAVLTNNESGAVTLGGVLNLPASSVTVNSGSTLLLHSDANQNFFAGPAAGNTTTSGAANEAFGFDALEQNTSGSQNTAIGNAALFNNKAGSGNTAAGYEALENNLTGSNNTAIGYQTLLLSQQGSSNIAVGYHAGFNLTTGSSNIYIGSPGVATESNTIHIGTPGVHTNTIIAGTLSGDGSGLLLSSDVALLSAGQTFTGPKTFAGGFVVNTSTGTLDIIDDQQAVPGIVASGGAVSGHMRFRNALEVWPDFAGANGGYLDVRGTNGNNITISLTGQTGAIVCSNVTANGVKLTSDQAAKENFAPVNAREILDKVAAMPVTQWNYKTEGDSLRHIGPMAQDFHASFGLDGSDDKHISVVDEGGVALAAIQGLNQKLNEKDAEIAALQKEIAAGKELNARMEARFSTLENAIKQISRASTANR